MSLRIKNLCFFTTSNLAYIIEFILIFVITLEPVLATYFEKNCAQYMYGNAFWKSSYGQVIKGWVTIREGFSGISKWTSEVTTLTTDPSVSTHTLTAQSQSWSSWGPCAFFASQMKEDRKEYIAQNIEEIKKDIAYGKGGHLDTLASFGLCEESSKDIFASEMQRNIKQFVDFNSNQKGDFANKIDEVTRDNDILRQKCHLHQT